MSTPPAGSILISLLLKTLLHHTRPILALWGVAMLLVTCLLIWTVLVPI
jgi:hypothetical protein